MALRFCVATVVQGLLTASLGLCAIPLMAQERTPAPSAAAQGKAMGLVKELYGGEYAKAGTDSEKISLAKKMIQSAQETTDPSNRFVLLRVAKDIAVGAGDTSAAMQAIDILSDRYDIDAFQMKAAACLKCAASAKSTDQKVAAAECGGALIEQAKKQNQFELAKRLCEAAISVGRSARQWDLVKRLVDRQREVESLAKEYGAVTEALKKLEANPTDAEANVTAGKYLCFIKGEWAGGLPMLALGGDAEFKRVAVMELEESPNALALGDAWWDLAASHEDRTKLHALARALTWYQTAMPELESNLLKGKIEKRISTIREVVADEAIGPTAPEAAVSETIERGLKWLVAQQRPDGSWTFATGTNPGSLYDCTEAATGMALIPLLRAGSTHRAGAYKKSVGRGLSYLLSRMKGEVSGRSFYREGSTMYGHGICTIALGEAYAHSKDEKLRAPVQAAVDFIVYAQDPNGGGWRYRPRQSGDTSVLGWQLQALVISDQAGITVPKATYAGVATFLNKLQSGGGVFYGYRYMEPSRRDSTTAIGLWSRLQLDWKGDDSRVQSGVKHFVDSGCSETDYYGNYYVSSLLKACGQGSGNEWAAQMHRHLEEVQSKSGNTFGSWFVEDNDYGGKQGGRLYCTSMALMTLLNLSQ